MAASSKKTDEDNRSFEYHSNKKTIFYRMFFSVDVFKPITSASAVQNEFVLRLTFPTARFDDLFAPAYAHDEVESLFFSLCCSKRNVVQVDSRPH
jgi:hypothetical protein